MSCIKYIYRIKNKYYTYFKFIRILIYTYINILSSPYLEGDNETPCFLDHQFSWPRFQSDGLQFVSMFEIVNNKYTETF